MHRGESTQYDLRAPVKLRVFLIFIESSRNITVEMRINKELAAQSEHCRLLGVSKRASTKFGTAYESLRDAP